MNTETHLRASRIFAESIAFTVIWILGILWLAVDSGPHPGHLAPLSLVAILLTPFRASVTLRGSEVVSRHIFVERSYTADSHLLCLKRNRLVIVHTATKGLPHG